MATAEQYAQWITEHPDKKGTPEFETVANAYRAARAAPVLETEKPQSLVDRFVGFSDDVAHGLQDLTGKYGRSAMQTGGMALGGLVAAPAALAAGVTSGGAGAAAVEAGGVGAGSAVGGHYYDVARDYFTGSKSPPLSDQAMQAAKDFSAGASIVPGARLVGGALSKAIPLAKTAAQRTAALLDAGATPAAQSVRQSALAKVLAQQDAQAAAAAQAAAGKQADVGLRSAMLAAADAQVAKGVGVSDIPEAKALVASLKAKLNPSGEVGTILLPDQAKPYEQIIETLAPRNGPKPDLESIANLRRAIAKAAYTGDQAGYNAIPKGDRKDLVRALNAVEDAYTGGLQAPVQANYAKMLDQAAQAKAIEKIAPDLQVAAAKLDTLSPADSITTARSIVDKLAKKQLISDAEHREFLSLADAATTAQGKAAFRKGLLKKVATYGALGVGFGEGAKFALHAIP